MTDYTVGDTVNYMFTTRRFSTGAPYALSGGVISAYEDNSTTQITAGITLSADFDTVTGLNHVAVVASGANGFESGKDYHLVITTGTVDSVSVVGEVVGRFTLGRSAAAVDLANGTDGLGAIKTDTAAILVDTGTTLDGRIPAALVGGRMDASVGAMAAATITAAAIATDAIDADAIAADAVTEIQAGLATAAALTTVDDFLDTEITAIKAKTDSLTFTVAGQVDANIKSVAGTTVTGVGSEADPWGP